jgi:NDP-sugar pyrophosphorylase family protein
MKIYAHNVCHDLVLCLGYRSNMIKEYFLNYEAMNSEPSSLNQGLLATIRWWQMEQRGSLAQLLQYDLNCIRGIE